MQKSLIRGLIMVLLCISRIAQAQKPEVNIQQQRLLLEMSSAFVLGAKDFSIDFDSAVVEASRYYGLNPAILASEDLFETQKFGESKWPNGKSVSLYKQGISSLSGREKTRQLALIGALYVFRAGDRPEDLDSARVYLEKAADLANDAGEEKLSYQAFIILGKYYLKRQQYDSASNCLGQVINKAVKSGDKASEAKAWYYWGLYHPFDMNSFDQRIGYLEKALALYEQLGNSEKQAACQYYIGGLQFIMRRFEKSRDAYLGAIRLLGNINFQYRFYPQYYLASVYDELGQNPEGVRIAIAAVKTAEGLRDSIYYGPGYELMGDLVVNSRLQPGDQVFWYKKALPELIKFQYFNRYRLLNSLAHRMNSNRQSSEALTMIMDVIDKTPPGSMVDRQDVANALGVTYGHLGNFGSGEKQFMVAELLEKTLEKSRGNVYKPILYTDIGDFYWLWKNYKKSSKYFNMALRILGDDRNPSLYAQVQHKLFEIDSANGQFLSAIRHYQESQRVVDSLFNSKEKLELKELSVRYNIEKKDNDIKLLTKQGELKEIQLKQSRVNNNIMIGSALMLALLSGLLYNRYRLKQKSHRQLTEQQQEINRQNNELKELVEDKNQLLTEKEWLVKEIHHRVKNNLQIIISLLNTQSNYLNNQEAVDAILESSHRMQAMSLIHQKLYQSEDAQLVNMLLYIQELVEFLETSFSDNRKICFQTDIDDIEMDISQAIPVGLILNEAITNAIKYAFTEEKEAVVRVIMKKDGNDTIRFEIADNGRGFPEKFNFNESRSMGMILIRGLVKQIGGKLEIASNAGARIGVGFLPYKRLATSGEAVPS